MSWRTFVVAAALASCAVTQWQLRAVAMAHKSATEIYEHVFYVPPVSTLQLLSLGQHEALADLLWARGLIYLGEEGARNLSGEYILKYGRAVTGLDPYFSHAYRVFAISANGRVGLEENEVTARIKESLAFLEDGVRMLPNDGELAWDTGSMYAYTLAPRLKEMDAYTEAKQRGIDHMRAATLRGFGPRWAGAANASTLVRLGQTEQAAKYLEELYAVTSDPDVRANIEAHLARLRSEAFMEGLRGVADELSRAHQRDFPYVPETMYLLLGKRPPFDRGAFLAAHFDPAFIDATPHEEDATP